MTIAAIAAPVGSARAESAAPACYDGNAYPYADTIPANIPSFMVEAQGWTTADTSAIRLLRIDGTSEVEVDATVTREQVSVESYPFTRYVIVPAAELVPGHEHVLRYDPCTGDGALERRYQVIDAMPLPDAPITVAREVQAVVLGDRISGHEVVVHLESASASLEPWENVLQHRVAVGPYLHYAPTRTESNRMSFRFNLECDAPDSGGPVVEGTFALQGSFAGFGLEPFAEAMVPVTIDCDDVTYVGTDGTPLTEQEIARIDRSAPPGGGATVSLDGATDLDAGMVDPDTVRSGPEPARACSVAVGGGGSPSLVLVALASISAVAAARRRRRH